MSADDVLPDPHGLHDHVAPDTLVMCFACDVQMPASKAITGPEQEVFCIPCADKKVLAILQKATADRKRGGRMATSIKTRRR